MKLLLIHRKNKKIIALICWNLLCFLFISCANPVVNDINENELKEVSSTSSTIETIEEIHEDYLDKIESRLLEMYDNGDDNLKISAWIWLKDSRPLRNIKFANEYLNEDEILFISEYTRVIIADISKERAIQLSELQDVISIYYHSNEVKPE